MKQNILLIEDDIFFQKFYITKLTESGYGVDVAGNGKEGLEKLGNNSYDLVLLDLVMPEMDGFEVLKRKSSDADIKDIPVVVFSTLSQEKDVEEAKNFGASDFINKTFYNFDDLLGKIQNLLTKNH